jgi:hypothetical protein
MSNDTDTIASDEESKELFFGPEFSEWRELSLNLDSAADDEERKRLVGAAKAAKEELKAVLLTSLQMQHVAVLAGSGTSLGDTVGGPSMWTLWDFCVNKNSGSGKAVRQLTDEATKVISDVGFNIKAEGENIEALLSRCDAYLQIRESAVVTAFVTASKKTILQKCTEFIDTTNHQQLAAHRTFLHRMSRRRARDSRLKLFTTNYDLCFENAAGKQGLVVLDGFSFSEPRHFDPRFFLYDIVRRPITGDEIGTPLEGVFHLYKLHGSVNWSRKSDREIEVDPDPGPEAAALIYPANGKYQQSYIQPHLELISQYLASLREPNTCLIVAGFGFNDDHLSEPILAAVRTNPHLRLIVVNPSAEELAGKSEVWKTILELAAQGEDVWLINASFSEFAEMIPDLKSLTPAQRLSKEIKSIAK